MVGSPHRSAGHGEAIERSRVPTGHPDPRLEHESGHDMGLMVLRSETSFTSPAKDPAVSAGLLPMTVALSYREMVSVKTYTSTVTPPLVLDLLSCTRVFSNGSRD